MVIVSLFDSMILLDPPDSIFWGVKCHDHCDNIVVNTLLDLKFSFIVDPMGSIELAVRYVLDILWWPPSYFPCISNNRNTKFPQLVPDDTEHKGTSKRHKTDKKSTHFAVHVSPPIFGVL